MKDYKGAAIPPGIRQTTMLMSQLQPGARIAVEQAPRVEMFRRPVAREAGGCHGGELCATPRPAAGEGSSQPGSARMQMHARPCHPPGK